MSEVLRYVRMWIIFYIFFYVVFSLWGCATQQESVFRSSDICPNITWQFRNGSSPEPDMDSLNSRTAEKGCVKYYGEGSCLMQMIKTGKDSYYALCRRPIERNNK